MTALRGREKCWCPRDESSVCGRLSLPVLENLRWARPRRLHDFHSSSEGVPRPRRRNLDAQLWLGLTVELSGPRHLGAWELRQCLCFYSSCDLVGGPNSLDVCATFCKSSSSLSTSVAKSPRGGEDTTHGSV